MSAAGGLYEIDLDANNTLVSENLVLSVVEVDDKELTYMF